MEGAGVHVRRNGKVAHYSDIRYEDDELVRMWRLIPWE